MKRVRLPLVKTIRSLVGVGVALTSGCATADRLLIDNQASAMQVATDRAKFDLPCATPTAKLLSSELAVPPIAQGQWAKKGRRAKYVIQADGCGKSKTFEVYCQEGDIGCEMLDNR